MGRGGGGARVSVHSRWPDDLALLLCRLHCSAPHIYMYIHRRTDATCMCQNLCRITIRNAKRASRAPENELFFHGSLVLTLLRAAHGTCGNRGKVGTQRRLLLVNAARVNDVRSHVVSLMVSNLQHERHQKKPERCPVWSVDRVEHVS